MFCSTFSCLCSCRNLCFQQLCQTFFIFLLSQHISTLLSWDLSVCHFFKGHKHSCRRFFSMWSSSSLHVCSTLTFLETYSAFTLEKESEQSLINANAPSIYKSILMRMSSSFRNFDYLPVGNKRCEKSIEEYLDIIHPSKDSFRAFSKQPIRIFL